MLETYPHLRDNDNKLIANVWFAETNKKEVIYFLKDLADGKLSSSESITRCRRKIQEQNPYLRGNRYRYRQNLKKEVQTQILDL